MSKRPTPTLPPFTIRAMSKTELAQYYFNGKANTKLLLSWLKKNQKLFNSLNYTAARMLTPSQVRRIVEFLDPPEPLS